MSRNKIIYHVTGKYMLQNKKRTITTLLGIVLMVVLLTCVFIGKDTVFSYLSSVASMGNGNWHVIVYGADSKQYEEIRELDYMGETAVSYDYGFTLCEASENETKPYWEIKGYAADVFDWMNISLVEGRYPQNPSEIIISESVNTDGADVEIGDTITADCFDRYFLGVGPDGSSVMFPFDHLNVESGQKVKLNQDFPHYPKGDPVYENVQELHETTGYAGTFTVVGIMEAPLYEREKGSFYAALTLTDNIMPENVTGNVIGRFDLNNMPSGQYGRDFDRIMNSESADVDYNDMVLIFSESSSENSMNQIAQFVSIFFVVLIVIVSMVLIYNVFNISFDERKKYLGMLSSVGATDRQRRSSVYFEAFLLLCIALPLGIVLGLLTVRIGMGILNPYMLRLLDMTIKSDATCLPSVKLCVNWKNVAFILGMSSVTVLLSAYFPARKIGKCSPLESIKGTDTVRKKSTGTGIFFMKYKSTIPILALKNIRFQRAKTKSIVRSITVFTVILTVTAFGARAITKMVSYRLLDSSYVNHKLTGYDYLLLEQRGLGDTYNAMKQAIMNDPDVEEVKEWQDGFCAAAVDSTVFSEEYWENYRLLANEYFDEPLTDETMEIYRSACFLSIFAVDDDTYEKIAKNCGGDMDIIRDETKNDVLFFQSLDMTTDEFSWEGNKARNYRCYELEHVSDLAIGDHFDVSLYNAATEQPEKLECTIAGYATAEDIKEYLSIGGGNTWIIVGESTARKMNEILSASEDYTADGNFETFERNLFIKLKEKDGELARKLKEESYGYEMDYFILPLSDGFSLASIAEAINLIIDIVAVCFVVFASFICLLNLFNSVRGRSETRKKEMAMLRSVGMEQRQIDRMLFWENICLFGRGILWSLLFSIPVVTFMKKVLMNYFGHIKMPFPWEICALAMALTAISLYFISKHCYHFGKGDNILEELKTETV